MGVPWSVTLHFAEQYIRTVVGFCPFTQIALNLFYQHRLNQKNTLWYEKNSVEMPFFQRIVIQSGFLLNQIKSKS